ncbi:MAG: hypothetical protein UZ21_OP11001000961 [Microgenomates bacterium OLB22]|nr:MAG: hypothetical protein UZ21_OP11001000961 [Microgenomates bacterium OLB22]
MRDSAFFFFDLLQDGLGYEPPHIIYAVRDKIGSDVSDRIDPSLSAIRELVCKAGLSEDSELTLLQKISRMEDESRLREHPPPELGDPGEYLDTETAVRAFFYFSTQ